MIIGVFGDRDLIRQTLRFDEIPQETDLPRLVRRQPINRSVIARYTDDLEPLPAIVLLPAGKRGESADAGRAPGRPKSSITTLP